jgi:mRNA interferase YafQ
MLKADYTSRFKKDYKLAMKRGDDLALLDAAITDLINERPLPKQYRDHMLVGQYRGCHECHLLNDWLLIYQLSSDTVVFERVGTHSDLFR